MLHEEGPLALNQIHLGNCLELFKRVRRGSIDMILCDLPYGTTACQWDTVIPFPELWAHYERIIKPGGAIVLTASQPFTSALVMSNPSLYRHSWVWEKETGVNFLSAKKCPMKVHEDICVFFHDKGQITGRTDQLQELREYFNAELKASGLRKKDVKELLGNHMVGHYFTSATHTQFSLPSRKDYEKLGTTGRFQRPWEELKQQLDECRAGIEPTYTPQKTRGAAYIAVRNGVSGDVTGNTRTTTTINNGDRYPRSVIRFNREVGLHPTQKPVALFEYLIKTYSSPGEVVLDNCMGSGTTAVAALNTGRQFIGMEMDPTYWAQAVKRVERTKRTPKQIPLEYEAPVPAARQPVAQQMPLELTI